MCTCMWFKIRLGLGNADFVVTKTGIIIICLWYLEIFPVRYRIALHQYFKLRIPSFGPITALMVKYIPSTFYYCYANSSAVAYSGKMSVYANEIWRNEFPCWHMKPDNHAHSWEDDGVHIEREVHDGKGKKVKYLRGCLLYTSPSPRD